MFKRLKIFGLSLGILSMNILPIYGEPILDDLPLDNYRLYSTVTIDLHDSIKDPGNEYVIRWYANEELVNEVYGLFGNQIVTYQYCMEDNVGKQVYAVIEAYNTKEVAKTEKRILEPASGNVSIRQDENKLVADITNFDNTSEYNIKWYIGDEKVIDGKEIYDINLEDVGKNGYCIVTSMNNNHSAVSNRLDIINPENTNNNIVYNKTNGLSGEWINGISGRWYRRKDGSHPVGDKQSDGNIKYAWEEIDGKWFAFNELGYATNGFIKDSNDNEVYYTNAEEGLSVGWKEVDGNWYYFNEVHDGFYGKMLKNTVTPDGYRVNENGIWIEQ